MREITFILMLYFQIYLKVITKVKSLLMKQIFKKEKGTIERCY